MPHDPQGQAAIMFRARRRDQFGSDAASISLCS
jgi:hypothetical protein